MEVFKWIFKLCSPQWFSFQLHKGNHTRIHLIHPSVRKCWSVVISDAVGQWVISTPCWPGPGFIRVKQLRVYARNINDGDTLCDPPHKGSLVTTKDSCEATGPASQTGEAHVAHRFGSGDNSRTVAKGCSMAGLFPWLCSKFSCSWGAGHALFLRLGVGFTSVFSLWAFTYKKYILSCVDDTLQSKFKSRES